ncbi:hypothetical protein, partial [Burkholderia anthina]|uniref:hypothetical protein n=1 Tax=Burkholderia anthina TaxID=179879 RepID=UPI001ABAD3A9
PLTNHGSLTPNAASNSLLCMTCLRLVYGETGTISPTENSTEANIPRRNWRRCSNDLLDIISSRLSEDEALC